MPQSLLLETLRKRSAQAILKSAARPDLVSSEIIQFPFLAVVGQVEMKTALVLSVINPAVGGVLLIGPRGTGKRRPCAGWWT